MNKNIIIGGIVVLAILGVGYLTMSNSSTQSSAVQEEKTESVETVVQENPSPTEKAVEATGSMEKKEVTPTGKSSTRTFTVEGSNFSFSLKEMRVKKGDTVKVVFTNKDGFHDWSLDEFSAVTKQIPAGQSETVQFVADKAGTFEYYCSVGEHRQNGMVGKLIVE